MIKRIKRKFFSKELEGHSKMPVFMLLYLVRMGNFISITEMQEDNLVDGQDRPLLDKYERPIDFRQYRQGVVFRVDQEFRNVEILAENFHNGFEIAVDSYGTMWQSDQEEPGNGADRVSYVMENGNFGYIDEMNGASWRINHTNLEDEIPRRHWHQNDPGVVPNLLETGSGFPMGMVVYEGDLLPRRYWDQIILADAGQNTVSAFPDATRWSRF